MIYLYFDSNNVLRETIQTKSFIQGSTNVDGIAVYSELFEDDDFTLDDIWYTQQLPDDSKTNEVSFIDNLQEGVIPYNAKADYKYFKDYTTYKFYVFEFTTEYLSQRGLNIGTIRLSYDNSIVALGEITFNVGTGVVKDDNYITQSQYDYLLLAYASRTLNATAGADLETLLDDKVEAKVESQVEEVFDPFKEEVNARLDNQDDRITTEMASIVKPTYYDVNSLPTTDVGLVVGSDGYIYSWNGTEYVATGIVYQATQLNDKVINEIAKVKNLYNSINYASGDLQTGYFYDDSGNPVSNANSVYLPEIDVSNYIGGFVKIIYKVISSGSARFTLFKSDNDLINAYNSYRENLMSPTINEDGYYELNIPIKVNCSKFYFSMSTTAQVVSVSINKEKKNEIVNVVNDKKELIQKEKYGFSSSGSTRMTTSTFANHILGLKKVFIELPENIQTAIFYRYSENEEFVATDWNDSPFSWNVNGCYDFHFKIRKSDNSAITTSEFNDIAQDTNIYNEIIENNSIGNLTLYVSPNGNDNSTGTLLNSLATVNKALELGANTIMLLNGEYNQQIDLSKAKSSNIKIAKLSANGKVLFRDTAGLIGTSATLEAGYTKVYKCATTLTFGTNLIWLFQENVADTTTLISDTDRLPEQRGYEYRCSDTKIEKCEATTLSDALTEIENATKYKWYYDNGYIYFSSPQVLNETHPLITSKANTLFKGNATRISLDILGIDSKYYCFNLTSLVNVNVVDCSSSNVFGNGAFTYDNTLNITFKRCEATRCFIGNNGDGFNGHSTNSGEVYAHQTTCQLINCWSHDNNDDGYSDHEKCEVNIYGGLYEHNKKGGITPSFGSHCTCYNVISRNNYNGFFCCGLASDGGKYTQMTCFNCYAYSNGTAGFRVDNATGNTMVLIECISKSNSVGYRNDNEAYSKLVNCYTLNNTTIKQGNFTIENATLVE